ncbi:hypothetical protein DEO45_11500 [Rhodanobacter denitrificans]|uniref:Uncharacterized protein n=1 Tax=Rhodanobacter denitrificans TaxID=666685 RepID=A0A368KGG2_9GAMM|nr:DUF6600 domain-containing protein [Rhodanobacter denitrificans]RCS29763.1 hypothetical protein DEO45_11500 [Rhodanobacter denitrificans]
MPRSAELSASWRRHWRALAIVLLCAAAGLVQAQSRPGDGVDPPSRVARLSYIAGDLGLLPAGARDWSDANINRPLTTGDKLSSARDARAELEFGGGTLRIDDRTDVGLLDLDDKLAQLELTRGTLNLTVRRLGDGQSYEIDTPTVALVVDRPGTFRVDVDDRDGGTQVTAFDGDATVFGENNAQRTINPGRSYRFTDASLATVTITDIDGGDAFDDWVNGRERRYARSESRRYVSEDVVGYQDLDQYGSWRDTSEYGAVWFPSQVDSDWAPYRTGHWAYIAPWGWTWVDDAPWGFAPYHYGRWAYVGGGWGWIPGPVDVRPIYAPALVAFVGGGSWSIGIGSAPVGWFPLGPGEVYNPWYRCDRSYYTRVNVTNIYVNNTTINRTTVINNIDNQYNNYRAGRPLREAAYANRMAPRGFTAVPGHAFADGSRVQRDRIRVDPRKLADAPVLVRGANRSPPVAGSAMPPRSAHVRDLPTGGFERTVVARHAPPGVTPEAVARGRIAQSAAATRDEASHPNVRMLDARGNADRGSRPALVGRDGNGFRQPQAPGTTLPAVNRITPAAAQGNPSAPREGAELRSARFAHPRGRDIADHPRPGVSYIAPADRAGPPSAARTALPPVPQIRRATPADRESVPAAAERTPRYEPANRAMQRDTMPARAADEPRFQRPEPAPRFQRQEPMPRGYVHEQAPPTAAAPPREMMQPPRPQPSYQPPPPRFNPPPRVQQAPQPPRGEPRQPPRKPAPRDNQDRQQD